jgi:riboflavin kinase/FMN adenylyltransferase
MKIIDFNTIEEGSFKDSAVTIGNFDGVHLGHREIISRVIDHAQKFKVPSVVITFDPHPREVIIRGNKVPAIFPFSERIRLISKIGADYLVKINFTPEFASQTGEEFLGRLAARLHPRVLVIGHDFRFGKGRQGGEGFLKNASQDFGFELEVVPAVEYEGEPVSSSRIRALVADGDLRMAGRLLAGPFSLQGEVIQGHGRGKGLGFATANLKWETTLIPPDGVYAANAYWNGHRYPAVVNIGDNPTFGDQAVSIEAHIMGFSGDLYEKFMRLDLIERLRGEIKFDSPEQLTEQIKKDVEKATAVLKSEAADQPGAMPEDSAGGRDGPG